MIDSYLNFVKVKSLEKGFVIKIQISKLEFSKTYFFPFKFLIYCRVGQGRSDVVILFPLNPRQTIREVFPHTAFLNNLYYN